MTQKQQAKLAGLVYGRALVRSDTELALGHLRYEALRKLNRREFVELCERNVAGEFFDDMVDEIVVRDSVT